MDGWSYTMWAVNIVGIFALIAWCGSNFYRLTEGIRSLREEIRDDEFITQVMCCEMDKGSKSLAERVEALEAQVQE